MCAEGGSVTQPVHPSAVNIECVDLPLVNRSMKQAGVKVFDGECSSPKCVSERVHGSDTLVHFFTDRPLPALAFQQGNIRRIIVAGPSAGCFADEQALRDLPIEVFDTPAKAITSVAEHTVALIMALAKQLPQTQRAMEQGAWPKTITSDISSSILGLIGFGEVAQKVAVMCHGLGFDVCVAASDSKQSLVEQAGFRFVSLGVLLEQSDFVSVHKRLTSETRALLSADKLQKMKPGSCLINTSRAELVDIQEVQKLLVNGRLGGAAMDVFDEEPLGVYSPLRRLNNVIVTPHNAWLTENTINKMVSAAVGVLSGDESLARRVQ